MDGVKVEVDRETDEDGPSAPASCETDITSAAVAASNKQMNRLQALCAGGRTGGKGSGGKSAGVTDTGRRRQTVDEIRRRLPWKGQLSSSNVNRRTFPTPTGAPPESPNGLASVSSVKSSYG